MAITCQRTTKINRYIGVNMKEYIELKIKSKMKLTKREIAYFILFMAKKRQISKYIKLFRQ